MPEAFVMLSGRLGRFAYFGYSLALGLVMAVLAAILILPMYHSPNAGGVLVVVLVLLGVLGFWGGLALTVKRLHDLNLSGWHYVWIGVLPAVLNGIARATQSLPVGVAALVLTLIFGLFLLFWPGTDGANNYGYRP
jgi:uncharacterized membrane protein YhaH (DUF805 family)